jgi:hypothetical protein
MASRLGRQEKANTTTLGDGCLTLHLRRKGGEKGLRR